MKTAVTVINTVQTGMDNYKDVRTTKYFDDSATLFEIKEWIKFKGRLQIETKDVSLASVEISDVE